MQQLGMGQAINQGLREEMERDAAVFLAGEGVGVGIHASPMLPTAGLLDTFGPKRVRDTPVLLGPEVALMLDPVGQAVLAELDGARDLATIAQELAARYDAPVETVLADIAEFLDGLAARRLVDVA